MKFVILIWQKAETKKGENSLGTVIEITKKPVIAGIPEGVNPEVWIGIRIMGRREKDGYLVDGSDLINALREKNSWNKEAEMLKQQKIGRIKLFIPLEYCEAVFQ